LLDIEERVFLNFGCSLAATKLPNYVLPLYPAIALLTARLPG